MFTLLGIDDEVTVCELCGKADLKCTMVLAQHDADGNTVAEVRYGRDCGARALGWRVSADRAERLARGETVRFAYEPLYAITCTPSGVGEVDGVRLRVDRTCGNKRRAARMVAEGWHKGPADIMWRAA